MNVSLFVFVCIGLMAGGCSSDGGLDNVCVLSTVRMLGKAGEKHA